MVTGGGGIKESYNTVIYLLSRLQLTSTALFV
jgi:hypothetical protein